MVEDKPEVSTDRLLWIDLEMSGLDPEQDVILEVAMVVTASPLFEIVAEFGPFAIRQPNLTLESMNPWCQKMHQKTGLWQRVQASQKSLAQIEAEALQFAHRWLEPGLSPACGNSVFHDRRFLRRGMPLLENFFHYRCLDVSTVKELVKRLQPELLQKWKKPYPHEAMEDIRQSVEELKFYRQHFFRFDDGEQNPKI